MGRLPPKHPPPAPATARSARRKLLTLAEREGVQMIVFGHDAAQWPALRRSPACYA